MLAEEIIMKFLVTTALGQTMLGLLIVAAGCNRSPQETYPVHGRVDWADGKPAGELAEGTVELQVIEGVKIRVSPRGEIQTDGTFVLRTYAPGDGAPAGKYRAVVMPKRSFDDEIRAQPLIVHSRFLDFKTTPLRVEVLPEKNDVKLQVERAAGR